MRVQLKVKVVIDKFAYQLEESWINRITSLLQVSVDELTDKLYSSYRGVPDERAVLLHVICWNIWKGLGKIIRRSILVIAIGNNN